MILMHGEIPMPPARNTISPATLGSGKKKPYGEDVITWSPIVRERSFSEKFPLRLMVMQTSSSCGELEMLYALPSTVQSPGSFTVRYCPALNDGRIEAAESTSVLASRVSSRFSLMRHLYSLSFVDFRMRNQVHTNRFIAQSIHGHTCS